VTVPSVYSTDTTKFVAAVSVILFAPVKVNVVRTLEVVRVLTSTVSEVARAAPVGIEDVPNVPLWA